MPILITPFYSRVNEGAQTLPLQDNWDEYFPLPNIRPKQEKAMDFVFRMLDQGVRDIIIAAPTGVGKSAIGATIAFWSASRLFPMAGAKGAYYLCTQKLLQDQLANDIIRYPPMLQSACSLKTASEYACPVYKDCGTGRKHVPPCTRALGGACTYKVQVAKFLSSDLAITNYPYFFTERSYLRQFPQRRILVCDECHTLENQLFKFAELVIGQHEIERFMPTLKYVPPLQHLDDFANWLETVYLVGLKCYFESFDPTTLTPKRAKEYDDLLSQIGKVERALDDFANDPGNWVYWQEIEQRNGTAGTRVAIAKPIKADGYFNELVRDAATVRVYMSAYPGAKDIFCRSLGLDPEKAAMLHLGSVFAKENRPIHLALVGSMSKKNQEETMPSFLRFLRQLMDGHAEEKGIIHCLDERTRILTTNGLKNYRDIKRHDQLFTLNPSTRSIDLEYALIIAKPFSGALVYVKNKNLSMAVTPDHDVFAAPGRNGERYTKIKASDLIGGCHVFGGKKAHFFKVPRSGLWQSDATFSLGPLHGLDGAKLLGWFLSEGCVYETNWHGKHSRLISIAQTGIATTEIPDLVRRCGLYPYVNPSQPDQLIIQNKALWLLLREHCYTGETGAENKCAPKAIKNSSRHLIAACLESLIKGDGTRSSNSGKRAGQAHAAYYTSSWALCQDVVELAIKAGYSACFRQIDRSRWKPSTLDGRLMPGTLSFTVEIGPLGADAWFHSSDVTTQNYTGNVWCPITKNGIVLAERDGKIYWTGNCNSYALGTAIFKAFQGTDHGLRLLFPVNADEREGVYRRHLDSLAPTIILSPSFTEGFDFADDAARWQVIAKIPYPYLGDKQVAAKKDLDPEWYAQRTVEKIIQASGRICRNETDHGVTYITDSDFEMLWERYKYMFPQWWTEALIWH